MVSMDSWVWLFIGLGIGIPFSIVANVLTDPAKRWVTRRSRSARERLDRLSEARLRRLLLLARDPEAYRLSQYLHGLMIVIAFAGMLVGIALTLIGIGMPLVKPGDDADWLIAAGGLLTLGIAGLLVPYLLNVAFNTMFVALLREELRESAADDEEPEAAEAQQ
ncbi:hypothetical protein HII36_17165 [Nonomuraea sp. NN258]|uniref:hypothetical protein n=1 Tax=Nonomuraea antri TaxID=2730852 RepID=UPI0015697373|nr:hypothetical protein [Nonomuraea antri]NRQ33567.1 hypothetical protein [Nonomuraea antri]